MLKIQKIVGLNLVKPSVVFRKPLDEIPNIDIVTVSHNHYDHLDIHSLKKISKKHPEAIFLVPAGDKKLLKRNGNIITDNSIPEFTRIQKISKKKILFY